MSTQEKPSTFDNPERSDYNSPAKVHSCDRAGLRRHADDDEYDRTRWSINIGQGDGRRLPSQRFFRPA